MRSFYWRWLKTAFTRTLGLGDLATGIAMAAVGVFEHYVPKAEIMTTWGWAIPVYASVAVVVVRLLLAPYWMWLEDQEKARAKSNLSRDADDPLAQSHAEFVRQAVAKLGEDEKNLLRSMLITGRPTSGYPPMAWHTLELSGLADRDYSGPKGIKAELRQAIEQHFAGNRRRGDFYTVGVTSFTVINGKTLLAAADNIKDVERSLDGDEVTVEFQNPVDPDTLMIRAKGSEEVIPPIHKTSRRVRFKEVKARPGQDVWYKFEGHRLDDLL